MHYCIHYLGSHSLYIQVSAETKTVAFPNKSADAQILVGREPRDLQVAAFVHVRFLAAQSHSLVYLYRSAQPSSMRISNC